MTGVQTALSESRQAGPVNCEQLSNEWSGAEELRAITSSIPADQRSKVLSSLQALLLSTRNDTMVGKFNA